MLEQTKASPRVRFTVLAQQVASLRGHLPEAWYHPVKVLLAFAAQHQIRQADFMLKPLARKSDEELRSAFPIDDRVPGWFFRVEEVSAGAYKATGVDAWGRRVESTSGDPERALEDCTAFAERVCGGSTSGEPGSSPNGAA